MFYQCIFNSDGEIIDTVFGANSCGIELNSITELFEKLNIEGDFKLQQEHFTDYDSKRLKCFTSKIGDNYQFIVIDNSEIRDLEDELESQRRISDLNMVRLLKTLDDQKEIKASLAKKNEYKEDFISSKSHKMRTSLTDIMGVIEVLSEIPKEEQNEFIEIIKKSSKELLEIINEFQES